MKCEICKGKAELIFLEKPLGTYVGSGKSRKFVCSTCQKSSSHEEILEKLTK